MVSSAAILYCRNGSDDNGSSGYHLEISGKSLLDIVTERLERTGVKEKLLVFESAPAYQDVIDAKNKGCRIASRSFFGILWVLPSLTAMLKHRYMIILDLQYPFVDPNMLRGMLTRMEKEGLLLMENMHANPFVPRGIVARKALFFGVCRKLFEPRQGWLAVIRSAVGAERRGEATFTKTALAPCFTADTVHPELIEVLGGPGFSYEDICALESSDPSFKARAFALSQGRLSDEMQQSVRPHLVNLKLLHFESRNSLAAVKSYPYDLALNISTLCNAHCEFCSYRPIKSSQADFFTLADIKGMTFLKYVSKLGLGGAIGDPLMNPEFPEIFRYLKDTYPHLILRIITNGIGLNSELCTYFAGKLARIRISLNAATGKTWEGMMHAKGFDHICTQVAFLADSKKRQKTAQPEIILLMVVNRENIYETIKFVELAHALGADAVNFSHFMSYAMPECAMPGKASLYYQPDIFDECMARSERRAAELGIRIFDRPPDFTRQDAAIFEGIRDLKAPKQCYSPWYRGFLVHGRRHLRRQMQFCCVGVDTNVDFKTADLDEISFARLWNHDLIRQVRQTVNTNCKNRVCLSCRSIDKADPEYVCKELEMWN